MAPGYKVRDDATLRFMMAAPRSTALVTFEGSFMAIRTAQLAVALYRLDRRPRARWRARWVAMITFGAIYASVPWLWKRERMYSARLVKCTSGSHLRERSLRLSRMWNFRHHPGADVGTYNESGTLAYSFADTMVAMRPYYIARAIGAAVPDRRIGRMLQTSGMTIRTADQPVDERVADRPVPQLAAFPRLNRRSDPACSTCITG